MTYLEQTTFLDDEQKAARKHISEQSCEQCRHYSALRDPRERSDGAVIYGYCFKNGDKDYSPDMGKGYAVFIQGGTCKSFKNKVRK